MNKFGRYAFIIIILSLLCMNTPIFALIIDVPADRPTIQSGIDAAENGDTILVANGVYKGDGNVNLDFKGKLITVKSENGPEATVIDCEATPNTRGFIFQNGETNGTILDGFTIKGGSHDLGGGIYCINASPTIRNSVIAWNRAEKNDRDAEKNDRDTGLGGGIYAVNSDVKIIDSKILNNTAEYYGAGVYFEGNDSLIEDEIRDTLFQPTLINCTVSENKGHGVVSWHFNIKTVITDSEVSKNNGRGIVATYFARGGTYISNCLISQNTGGGVECSEFSIMEITDSIIRQNTAREGGGIYVSPSGIIEVSDCIIAQNIATRWGGGIRVAESKWGQVEITHCTITQNTAGERGGGLYVDSLISFTLTDSIVWGNNSDKTHAEIFVSGRWIVIKSNDIRDGLDGIGHEPDGALFVYEDNIDKDPLFVDADRGDYSLKQNSPEAGMGAQTNVGGALSVVPAGKRLVMWGDLKRK